MTIICQEIHQSCSTFTGNVASGSKQQLASTRVSMSSHHRDFLMQMPRPPPPPRIPKNMSLAAATLPRNFGHNQPIVRRTRQGTSSSTMAASTAATAAANTGLMQLPSPPDPPSSFALSALVS